MAASLARQAINLQLPITTYNENLEVTVVVEDAF